MRFRPYVASVQPYRSDSITTSAEPNAGTPLQATSVLFPVAAQLDLNLIPAEGVKDYFLWHPLSSSIQNVLVGNDTDIDAPAGFSIQLMQFDGSVMQSVSDVTRLTSFTITPQKIALPGSLRDGPIYARITSAAANILLLVTLHAMTSQVP